MARNKDDAADDLKAMDTRTDNRSGSAPDPLEPDRGPGARSHGWSPAAGRDAAAGGGSPDDRSGDLGPVPARGPQDVGADDLQPVASGDAANVGPRADSNFRNTLDATNRPGGGTLGRNVGDTAADAGDGSIDATDATSVTGDPDISPANLARDEDERGGTGPGTIEGAGDPSTGYRQGGASGALGPEDMDGSDEAVDPTGPAADTGPKGDPRQHGRDTGLGRAVKLPETNAGRTNVRGPGEDRAPF